MKTRFINLPILALVIFGLGACKGSDKISLPPCTGKPGEVLIIMPDDIYKGIAGDTLVAALTQEEPALPQSGMEGAEAMFNTLHLPPSGLNNTVRPARNMIIADISAEITQAEIKVFKDYWAQDQVLIFLKAPDRDQFVKLVTENAGAVVEILRVGEVDRQTAYSRKYRNEDLFQKISKDHQIEISLPKGFELRVDTGNFVWAQSDQGEITQGILLWSYPYQSEKQLEVSELQSFTNKYLEPRVPGPSAPAKRSFMQIVPDVKVYSKSFMMDGLYVHEMKGLWEVKPDFMGGPFISWTFVDEKRNRLVTAFGFVYAPKVDKRNWVRKVEGMLKTVRFPS